MSLSIPSPACRIAVISYSPRRRLVPVPFSSRIGYRMISQRNPSHAISDTTTSASAYFRPVHLPAPSHRPTCFPPRFPPNRVARRVGLKPDAILPATRLACPPCLLAIISLIAPSHRLIRSARCLPALSAARRRSSAFLPCCSSISSASPHLIGSSLVPLPSRSASRRASRRASRLVSSRLTSRHVSSTLLANLIHLVHLIRFAPSHRLIAHAHRMRRATSRRNGARDGQSTTVKRNATTSDTSPIPQTPLPACRIAHTSRATHGHQHEHTNDKTPPL